MFGLKLKPREDDFFRMFEESAVFFHQGAQAMYEATEDFDKLKEKTKLIADIEHAADDLNDTILDKLNQTFITPLDREDIYTLVNKLDDASDFVQGTTERMLLYRAGQATPGALELTKLVVDASAEIIKALKLLKNVKANQHKILDHLREISALESAGDRIYRREVAHLFESNSDPIHIIKWKEILEYLENTLDHCEDIADLIRGVVMKYA